MKSLILAAYEVNRSLLSSHFQRLKVQNKVVQASLLVRGPGQMANDRACVEAARTGEYVDVNSGLCNNPLASIQRIS